MSEQALKTLRNSGDFQAEYSRAVISNGYHQRMSVSVVAPPRNQTTEPLENRSQATLLLTGERRARCSQTWTAHNHHARRSDPLGTRIAESWRAVIKPQA
jgi:hypothetical protein